MKNHSFFIFFVVADNLCVYFWAKSSVHHAIASLRIALLCYRSQWVSASECAGQIVQNYTCFQIWSNNTQTKKRRSTNERHSICAATHGGIFTEHYTCDPSILFIIIYCCLSVFLVYSTTLWAIIFWQKTQRSDRWAGMLGNLFDFCSHRDHGYSPQEYIFNYTSARCSGHRTATFSCSRRMNLLMIFHS